MSPTVRVTESELVVMMVIMMVVVVVMVMMMTMVMMVMFDGGRGKSKSADDPMVTPTHALTTLTLRLGSTLVPLIPVLT